MAIVQGQIVWAWLLDQAGRNKKLRPAVVLSNSADIVKGKPFYVAGITSHFDLPLPEWKVPLPWKSGRHPVTGLKKSCVAVCDWICRITHADVDEVAGIVPKGDFIKIANLVRKRNSSI